MRTISISEFQKLAESKNWKHEQEHEILFSTAGDHPCWTDQTKIKGIVYKKSILSDEESGLELKITYFEQFIYDEFKPRMLEREEGEDDWLIDGFAVLNEDDEEMEPYQLEEYLSAEFSSINYHMIEIDLEQITDVDLDEDSEMEVFIVKNDEGPGLCFNGELLAKVESSTNDESNRFGGKHGQWTELELYETQSGKYICHRAERVNVSQAGLVPEEFLSAICQSEDEVKKFFGSDWLAKELYEEAGIDDVS